MKQTTLVGIGIIAIALLVAGCASTQPPAQQPPDQQPPTPSNTGPSGTAASVAIKDLKFTPANAVISLEVWW